MTDRLQNCRRVLAERKLDALLVTHVENVRYLTGFTGSSGRCLLTEDHSWFVTDGRYILQASDQVKGWDIRIERQGGTAETTALLKDLGKPIAFEADHVSVSQLKKWQEDTSAEFVPASGIVEGLRMIKDAGEIAIIKDAVEIVDRTFEYLLGIVKTGMTEREVALELDFHMRRLGADKEGFDSIVASGPHSAWPHAHPTDRKIAHGDFLKLDFGAYYQLYNSDITRTVVMGEPSARQREIYDTVLRGQLAALGAIRAGVVAKDVDAAARAPIEAAGYGDNFTHNLGHSLGRSVHDGPGFGKTAEHVLEAGMVLTVEPGIYVEGLGGVRIEDDVVVTETGCDILTRSTKEMLCI
ncbi:MAG: Xaa-Pro peptidase family protein [Chloroflexi bacterium]|nr:Xaa-Pro peptidase family protein [Chloroflexota bacterium]